MTAHGTVVVGSLHHPLPPFVRALPPIRNRWDHTARTAHTRQSRQAAAARFASSPVLWPLMIGAWKRKGLA